MANYQTGASESQGVGIWKPCLLALVEYAWVAHEAHEAHGKGWRIVVVSRGVLPCLSLKKKQALVCMKQ